MNRTVVAILFPFLAVASGTIGVIWWDRGAPPGFNPTPHPTAIEALTREHRGVRIKGTAHYEVRLSQTMEGGEIFCDMLVCYYTFQELEFVQDREQKIH